MRDFDETNITAAVLDRFTATPDPRLKQIMQSLVRHLHDFARDVELTFEEWQYAIDYLTRTGRMCTDKRQEFILLSDTLGLSMLVDAINHRMPDGATETTVLGPFYVAGPPEFPLGADIAGSLPGEPLLVDGSVSGADGRPLAGAIVDVWQADRDGYYDVQRPELETALLRARFHTGADGKFSFKSVMPSFYPIPDDGPVGDMLQATARHPNRPAHIHFMIAAEGYQTLVTHVFAADSPYLDSDAVFGVKNSLIADFTRHDSGDGRMTGPFRFLTYDFGLKPSGK
ncbi:MAG TPA: intradiol ring-cleavage dioxygenase [Aliidongia sp.]|uniref:intradiol ring-cleavage dioxygenase n=1 Tax=Aliidongia sp. TaxID=1914230 RepID=UPI002DDCC24F|nr:intradiol ring-cleavage dioxygenase [Aliidongia sp.]HEV2677397.1 intradiol ring-cleavage dioxygenase [Aliidongia sp.]